MSREVPFDPTATCDICGAPGAYDFYGDYLCGQCDGGPFSEAPEIAPTDTVKLEREG